MKVKNIYWGLTIILFLVTGCSNDGEKNVQVDAEWNTVDGQKLALADLRGKWVIVNYWATWCPPCRKEMPDLEAFYQQHLPTGKATVIGVNFEDIDADGVQKFATKLGINFPIVHSNNLSGETPFGKVFGLPQTYILNPQGQLTFKKAGLINQKLLNEEIQ